MCGIIGIIGNKPAKKAVRRAYLAQKHRGQDGFGYIAIRNGRIENIRRATNEKDIMIFLKQETAETIIFHHRIPTSTPNIVESTHPIEVRNPKLAQVWYVVHNGIITNSAELQKKHKAEGFCYTTEAVKKLYANGNVYLWEKMHNDSEALAVELALYLEGKKEKVEIAGNAAFLAVEATDSGEVIALYYGANNDMSTPLTITRSKQHDIRIRSEGGQATLEAGAYFRYDMKTGETKKIAIAGLEARETYFHYQNDWGYAVPYEKEKGITDEEYISLIEERDGLNRELNRVYAAQKVKEVAAIEDRLYEIEELLEVKERDHERKTEKRAATPLF